MFHFEGVREDGRWITGEKWGYPRDIVTNKRRQNKERKESKIREESSLFFLDKGKDGKKTDEIADGLMVAR